MSPPWVYGFNSRKTDSLSFGQTVNGTKQTKLPNSTMVLSGPRLNTSPLPEILSYLQ